MVPPLAPSFTPFSVHQSFGLRSGEARLRPRSANSRPTEEVL
jgi:hypothetical protein